MKKLFLTFLFNIFFALPSFAQTIATQGVDNNLLRVRDGSECWECKLVEGVYTYAFNFVFKIYHVLQPVIYDIVLVFFAFWFLWIIYTEVIKKQGGNSFDLLKKIFIKIFTILFVWAMLIKVPANEVFKYTIDPIMSLGTGFGKWILVETRNDNLILQNSKLPKFNCDDIKLSQTTIDMLRVNGVDANDTMNTDTIKNLICVTREYSNTYNVGLNLGFKIASRGFVGIAANWGTQKINDNLKTFASYIPHKAVSIAVSIVLFLFQALLIFGWMMNFIIIVLGLGIAIAFIYVAFTFISIVLDIVIKLALVGVMMPIVIGAWGFTKGDITNLRSQLSGKLFWGVLRCAFRLIFLAITLSITTFLLTELMTTKFDMASPETIQTLYESLTKSQSLGQNMLQVIGLNDNTLNLVRILLSPGMFVAILLTTMICWMLLCESISLADSFSDSLYKGVSDDSVLKGLKSIVTTTYQTVKNGVKRDVSSYKKINTLRDGVADRVEGEVSKERASKLKQLERDVFENGEVEKIYDLPAENLINHYENIREGNNTNEFIGPLSKEDNDKLSQTKITSPAPYNLQMDNNEIQNIERAERQYIDDKLSTYDDYKTLPEDKKENLVGMLYTPDKDTDTIDRLNSDTDISRLVNTIQNDVETLFPMTTSDTNTTYDSVLQQMKDEYTRDKVLNLVMDEADNGVLNNETDRQNLKNFITKNADSKNKKLQNLYDTFKDRVKSDLLMKKKKLDEVYEQRRLHTLDNRLKSVLDARTVVQAIKKEELDEIQTEIDNLSFSDTPAKRFMLRRQLKKLQKEIDDIEEKDNLELEDEYDGIVSAYRSGKRKRKSKINPNKKV